MCQPLVKSKGSGDRVLRLTGSRGLYANYSFLEL